MGSINNFIATSELLVVRTKDQTSVAEVEEADDVDTHSDANKSSVIRGGNDEVSPCRTSHPSSKTNARIAGRNERAHRLLTKNVSIAHVPLESHDAGRVPKTNENCDGAPTATGVGAMIFLDYSGAVGATAGRGLTPTGNATDRIYVRGRPIDVTICDVGALIVLVMSKDITSFDDPTDGGNDDDDNIPPTAADEIQQIQCAALAAIPRSATFAPDSPPPPPPPVVLLSPPAPDDREAHVQARLYVDRRQHRSISLAAAACVAACARLAASVVRPVRRHPPPPPPPPPQEGARDLLAIRHPSGVLSMSATVTAGCGGGGGVEVDGGGEPPVFTSLSLLAKGECLCEGQLMALDGLADVWIESSAGGGLRGELWS